jgi:hypothetical protein
MLRRNLPRRNTSEFRQNTTPDHTCWHKTFIDCKGASCAADFSGLLPFVEMCILSIPALPRSQQDDGQRDGSRHICSLPTTQNPKAIDWSLLLPPSFDDDGQRSCDHSSVQYRRRRWGTTIAPTFVTSVATESEIASVPDFSRQRRQRRATMKPNFLLTSAETIRQLSSVSIHPDRI